MKSLITICLLFVSTSVFGGCYSDYCAGQRSGAYSSSMTLKYGGTYSQAASNYMNYSRGYGTSSGSSYYSPYYHGSSGAGRGISPQQKAEVNRLLQQSGQLINYINRQMQRY
jgi:hypothetical protein